MCEEKWNKVAFETLESMKEHVEPFISPIWKYKEENAEDLSLHGSASYVESKGEKYIITNDHVARVLSPYHFTHSFKGNENICILKNQFLSVRYPVDAAISKVDEGVWIQQSSEGRAIPIERFSKKHNPVEGELLFFAGFSGQRSRVILENCFSRGTPFLTQECKLPEHDERANPEFHIAIPYPPELVQTTDADVPLPDPHGFSGSLLWNTKRIEFMKKGHDWNPAMAEVTAIIWGWPTAAVSILATKIEHVNLEDMICNYR